MTALPAATAFTDGAITEAQFKSAITDLRAFLAGLLGTAGDVATAQATLDVLFGAGVDAKTGAYTVVAADRGKLLDCDGTFTLTLTAAATLGAGFAFAVRNSGSGTITLDADASKLIDGALTLELNASDAVMVVCTGTGWLTVGGKNLELPVSVANGGTGATTAADAATNLSFVKQDHGALGIGSIAIVRGDSGDDFTTGNTYSASNMFHAALIGTTSGGDPSWIKWGSANGTFSGTWRIISGGQTRGLNEYAIMLAQRIA